MRCVEREARLVGIKSGDSNQSSAAEFAAWVRPHAPVMRRLATVLAPEFDADDVVQEALLRAWQKRHTYDERRGTPRGWLLAVTADRARRMRSRQRQVFQFSDLDAEQLAGSSAAPADVDLRAGVQALPRRQKEVVVLYYYADLSVDETAQILGIAVGTVKSTLADARRLLARTLGEHNG
jgi:RNA polymerase sigma factor (sigma-70 family)